MSINKSYNKITSMTRIWSLDLLKSTINQGKTKYPAFSYLNENEWYALIEMHLKHHLKQKKNIDNFLKK